MDTDLLIKTANNEGWLEVQGIGLTRSVKLFDKVLDLKDSLEIANYSPDGFNWGYSGSGPTQLSVAILMQFMDNNSALHFAKDFTQSIVAHLPEGNFRVRIKMDTIVELFKGTSKYHKNIHAYQFVEVDMNGHWIPKLLDFAHGRYATYEFEEGTLEFEMLKNLTQEQLSALKVYTSTNTKRKDAQNLNLEVCTHVIGFNSLGNSFEVVNGMGTGTNTGLNIEEYERSI